MQWLEALRANPGAQRGVAVLRILLGFALLPSGLKKVLGERFTDLSNDGPFHDFLHALYATGFLYTFVGLCQLATALLLMTQRWASVGAALMAPIITVILVLCWSTGVYPTASVVTLMTLATALLLLWDHEKWRVVFSADPRPHARAVELTPPETIARRPWELCGLAIYLLYLLSCLARGGVYRPRGLEWGEPAFYVLPALCVLPFIAYALERRMLRGSAG